MAIKTVNQTVPDTAIEQLLSEIASVAYVTGDRPCKVIGSSTEELEREIDALFDIVARLGWMADIALRRLDSDNCLRQGEAEAWLLPPSVKNAIAQEVKS